MDKEKLKKIGIGVGIFMLLVFAHGIYMTITGQNVQTKEETKAEEPKLLAYSIDEIEKKFQKFAGMKEKTTAVKKSYGYDYLGENSEYFYSFATDKNKELSSKMEGISISCYNAEEVDNFINEVSGYFTDSEDIKKVMTEGKEKESRIEKGIYGIVTSVNKQKGMTILVGDKELY